MVNSKQWLRGIALQTARFESGITGTAGGAAESLCNTVKSLGIEDIRILIGLKSGNTRSLPDIRVEICMASQKRHVLTVFPNKMRSFVSFPRTKNTRLQEL